MGIFNFLKGNNEEQYATDAGDSTYINDELLGAYKNLSYEECRQIYRFWPLGKRVAAALPNFAMSAGRNFLIKNAPPEIAEEIKKTAEQIDLEGTVNKASIYARIYGLSFIFVSTQDNNPDKPLTYKDIQQGFNFNVLDPLAMGGNISIDINPLSYNFNKPLGFTIKGHKVNSKRVLACYNDIPLYYQWNKSSFSWSGPSIYQNMTLLIRSWNRAIIAIQRMSTKAASIIVKSKDIAYQTGVNLQAINKNLSLIRDMENDGITDIKVGEEVEFFNLTGISEIDTIIDKIHSGLMMALNDTPSSILLDRHLAQSMSDGDNDMKAIIIAVDKFRKGILTPIYEFVDKFLLYKTFSPALIKQMKNKYPDLYANMGENEILAHWMENYTFEYNNIYPLSKNEEADTQSKHLDNMLKIKELGGDLNSIEDKINQIYPNGDFVLSEENIENRQSDNNWRGFNPAPSNESPKGIDSPDTEL